MNLFIRLTYKGEKEETTFQLSEDKQLNLCLTPLDSSSESIIHLHRSSQGLFSLISPPEFEEKEDEIQEKLLGLSEEYMEALSQGFEITSEGSDNNITQKPGYNPDDIYVENKPFSIGQLLDLIHQGDLDLAPNFQRHFVWDRTRQSLLIESILLGLPLPALYLSQYSDGILTVVDGLQRINTIKNFMENKLRLCNLEYLQECNGKKYDEVQKVLSPLRIRRFRQTQLVCFVIDYRSPSELKFDLFRRLNTGSKPLNRQEIRNCLSRTHVQDALRRMTTSQNFLTATKGDINDKRMLAQEIALKFLYFRDMYQEEKTISEYKGTMDKSLDLFVEKLNATTDLEEEIKAYDSAMNSAYYLFGDQTFRKFPANQTKKTGINKSLILCLSVLLSLKDAADITSRYERNGLVSPMEELLSKDEKFYNAITFSTNTKTNIEYVMKVLREQLLKID